MPTSNQRHIRSHRATRKHLIILIVILVLVMPIAAAASKGAVGPSETEAASVWLDGPTQAEAGEEISTSITTDASGLFGAQLELSFDPAVLQVVGTQVTPGSCPKADFVVTNSVDNGSGKISYAATALSPSLPCDGGVVATFQFQVSPTAAIGPTQVQFDSAILADSDGMEIPATAVDLNLEIVGTVAEFSATPTAGPAPLTVNFSNLSSGDYDTCTWDFGDGGSSSLCEDQNHVYTAAGPHTVTLTVSGPNGSDSETKVDYIVVWQYWLNLPVILH